VFCGFAASRAVFCGVPAVVCGFQAYPLIRTEAAVYRNEPKPQQHYGIIGMLRIGLI